jgi:hypothetical protein
MRVLEYDLKKEIPEYSFKKDFDKLIKGTLKSRDIKAFGVSDFDSVVAQLDRIEASDKEADMTAQQRVDSIVDQIPRPGPENILYPDRRAQPSDSQKAKFVRLINVLSNPLIVFDLATKGELGFLELEVLENYMPELSDQMQQAAMESITGILSQDTDNSMSSVAKSQMSRFLGIPEISVKAMQTIQANFAQTGQKEEQASGVKNLDIDTKSVATPTSKIEAGAGAS